MKTPDTKRFGAALCEQIGLMPGRVLADIKVNCKPDELLSVTLTVEITAEDLSAIARRMSETSVAG